MAAVADDRPFLDRHIFFNHAAEADGRRRDLRPRPNIIGVPDDRPLQDCALFDQAVVADHRLRSNMRISLDSAVFADADRPDDLCRRVDLRSRSNPDISAHPRAFDGKVGLAAEHLILCLTILLQ